MTDNQKPEDCLADQEELIVANLPEELIARIDAALLAETQKGFLKVARIVATVAGSIPGVPEGVPAAFYAQRVAHLVQTGQLESQGDLRRMRYSEVRLPSPPLTKAEIEHLIVEGAYGILGSLYEQGEGVTQDHTEALRWYRMAAERGDVWSQVSVGRFYLNGYGVQQDYGEAYFWFSLAAHRSADASPFANFRDEVAPNLTPEQRTKAEKQVIGWKPALPIESP